MNEINASTLVPLWLTREELEAYRSAVTAAVLGRGEVHTDLTYALLEDLLRDVNNALGK